MTKRLSASRPRYFYSNWDVLCGEVLATILGPEETRNEPLAGVLVVGGALLGASGLAALVRSNIGAVNRKGKEWGIDNLAELVTSGGAVLGGILGLFGGNYVAQVLGKYVDESKLQALQNDLSRARRDFEEFKRDVVAKRISKQEQRSAVEHLFWKLTRAV